MVEWLTKKGKGKMKRLLSFMLVVLLVAGGAFAKQYRDFTDTKGRTIRGCIQAFDERSGTVTFERDSHRTSKVPITVFSESDQVYIREWSHARFFLSESSFRISAGRKKTKDKEKSYSGSTWSEKVEDRGYEVVLENRSATQLENLEVKYCIFYEQDEIKNHQQHMSEGVLCGDFSLSQLSPKTKKTLVTEMVKIYKRELSGGYYYDANIKNVQTGRVRGIWIRVTMKLSSGEKLTRDYCLPDSLGNSKAWMKSSVNVGMN